MFHCMHLQKEVGNIVLPETCKPYVKGNRVRFKGNQVSDLSRTAYNECSAVCSLLSLCTKNSLNCKEKVIIIHTVFAVSISIYGIIFHTHNYFYILSGMFYVQ